MPISGATLPVETMRPSSPRAIAVAIATCLLLVAAANAAAAWYLEHHPVNLGTVIVDRKWEIVERQTGPVDWLVLGDSSCNQGVDPVVLEQRLGGTTLNLCTIGDMLLLNDAWMLQRYVARVGPPRHVVIVHVADVWERDEARLQEALLTGAIAHAGISDEDRDQFVPPVDLGAADWVARIFGDRLPLYSQNASVGQLLRHPWTIAFGPGVEIRPDGFMVAIGADPKAVDTDARSHIEAWTDGAEPISAINRAALVEIARLGVEHGFDVVLASAPLYEGLYADPAYRRAFDGAQRDVQVLASGLTGVRVVFRDPMTFPSGAMQNADHLVAEAAHSYSIALADAIGSTSGASTSVAEPNDDARALPRSAAYHGRRFERSLVTPAVASYHSFVWVQSGFETFPLPRSPGAEPVGHANAPYHRRGRSPA